jgi:cytoskeleton protein RodZ
VFEIGNSLREARVRQHLDFPEIEQATKIRGKYLRALEDEQFEALPGQTYVKGFLRTYADYLGLEGQLYVDEYNSRYVVGGEEEQPVRFRSGGGPRSTHFMSSAVLISLTAIVLASALVIVAWKYGGASDTGVVPPPKEPAAKKHSTTRAPRHRAAPPTTAKTGVRLVVKATAGNSWLEVRRGSPAGAVEYQGTLLKGQKQVFTNRRLWLTIDAPANVVVKLNGQTKTLAAHGPLDLALTRTGLQQVS